MSPVLLLLLAADDLAAGPAAPPAVEETAPVLLMLVTGDGRLLQCMSTASSVYEWMMAWAAGESLFT